MTYPTDAGKSPGYSRRLGLFSGSLYVPIEVYELFEGISWPKVLIIAVNLLIVAYLANVLVRSSHERH